MRPGPATRPPYAPGRIGRGALAALARLPLPLLALLGAALGMLAYALDRRRRHIAAANLRLCFPGLAPTDARKLMRRHFRALTQSMLASIGLAWWRTAERLARYVRLKDAGHYHDALAQGRRVILLVPHFVSLEIGWLKLSRERPMVTMYRAPRRHLLHWAVHRHRLRFGGLAFERRANLKSLIRLIREGRPFYYLPDIDPGDKAQFVFAPFFGVPAATVTALGRIAQLTQAVVIPCITRQLSWGRYEVAFLPALEQFPSADESADARRMNALIEAQARATPEQYFWVHRRFKTRPPGAPSFYE